MTKKYIRWVPSPRLLKFITRWHTRLYRGTRGLVGSHMDGLDILLLTTRDGFPECALSVFEVHLCGAARRR